MLKKWSVVLLVAMAIIALFSILNPGGANNSAGIVSASDPDTNIGAYRVKNGDSLYLIAAENGTTVNDLMEDNGLESDLILPGQDLIIDENSIDRERINRQSVEYENIEQRDIDSKSTGQDNMDEIRVVIEKTHQKLSLYRGDTEVKVYKAHFGEAGMEDKEIQGDRKTPEGTFYITEKSVLTPADEYLGSRWLRLSYPNVEDARRGLEQGIIDRITHDSIAEAIGRGETPPQRTALGGGIGIHGGDVPEFGDNWTWGCIGLTNADAEEIYEYVTVGTPVVITR